MNNYSDNISLFSFNPVDYIDLDSALAEEELSSVTHINSRHEQDNYKFSLKSMNDKDLDSFRRSLITPMSTQQTQRRNSPIKRQDSVSPTHSCNESVTESVALFNNILNDDSVDFVKSDLKDFMTTFNMDDLLSRPNSRLPTTTPSPQNRSRYNRDNLVSRHSNIIINNLEKESNTKENLLTTTTTNMNTKDNVTQSNSNPNNSSSFIRGRKSSVDVSVQTTPSSFTVQRRKSTPALETNNDKTAEKIIPRTTTSKERVQKKLSLLKLSQNQQIHPSPQQTTTSKVNKSDDKRRWSSYIPSHLETREESSIMNQNNTSRYSSNLLPTNRYNTKEKRNSIIDNNNNKNSQQQMEKTRQVERRISHRSSLNINSTTSKIPNNEQHDLQRRSSNRRSLLVEPTTTTVKPSEKDTQQQQSRNTSDTVERRTSLRRVPLVSQLNKEKHNEKIQRSSSLNNSAQARLERRSSQGTFSLTNKKTNNETTTSKVAQPIEPRTRDTTTSNHYAERRSFYLDLTRNSKPSKAEDHLTFSNSRMERRPSQGPVVSRTTTTTIPQSQVTKNTKRYSYHGGYGTPPTKSIDISQPTKPEQQQPRRSRALSVPSSSNNNDQQAVKPSLMPVPVSRIRKYSNCSSRYATVPENEIAPSPPSSRGVRFSFVENNQEPKQEDILPTASRSTGGYSNSTASSHSGDIEYDPPTPPSSYIDRYESIKRRSIPNFPVKDVPPRSNRYSSYLARLKDEYEEEEETLHLEPVIARRQRVNSEEENSYVEPVVSRRQRVNSDDNEYYYKGQQRTRQQNQNAVTESARQLLAQVQERRAKTAAILNGIYGP